MSNSIYQPFLLEEYLEKREFGPGLMFCASDVESRTIGDLLDLASPDEREGFFNKSLAYTPPQGGAALRAEIAKTYVGLGSDQILCFSGAEEGIFCAMDNLLTRDDHVVVVTPTYQSLYSVAESRCEVSKVPLRTQGNQWFLDPADIAAKVTSKTKLIVMNFPNNPTGMIPPRETFEAVLKIAEQHGCYVFSDEVYRYIEQDDTKRLPAACELYPKALSLGVMSKSFGLAGLRVGWIACQDSELLNKLMATKNYLSICGSAPSEELATIALRNKELIWKQNGEHLRSNLAMLRSYFLSQPETFRWLEPAGGCIAYPQLLTARPVYDFADDLFKETGVIILPSLIFQQDNNHFRVSYGRRNMPEVLQRFASFVERMR